MTMQFYRNPRIFTAADKSTLATAVAVAEGGFTWVAGQGSPRACQGAAQARQAHGLLHV
jgi:hypothetical protein